MLKKVLFIFWQCTWGLAQTLLGAIFFYFTRQHPHTTYRGCIDTRWNRRGGLSLGLFIFTPNDGIPDGEKIRVHEYGHCIQSLVLGPLYLLIGLISVTWARLPWFIQLRKEKKIPYNACFVESWAGKWGEWVTGEEAIWN